MKNAREYTDKVYQSIISNWHNLMDRDCIYHGKKGALRLAREYGRGLADFPLKQAEEEAKTSYSRLCVRLYNLRPPVNAGEWIREILKVIE